MAHKNTVLAQLLNLIDRHDFQKLEKGQFKPPRKYCTLSRWSQFTTMMFEQITGRVSLRDISDSLQTQAGRLYHLGIGFVKRSTLVDANNRRPAEFFQAFFEKSYQRCAAFAPGKRSSDSKTSFIPSMHPQSIFAYQFSLGRNFARPKVVSNSTPCWIMMDIFLHLQVLLMPGHLILPMPEH